MRYLLEGISTERLTFRLLEDKFQNQWLPFFQHQSASKYLFFEIDKSPEQRTASWFLRMHERYATNSGGMNALIHKTTGKLIGQCGILVQEVDGTAELEIAYSILPEYWNQGYATEAAIKCKTHAFDNGFSHRLISIIHIQNEVSTKVALKNGLRFLKQTSFKTHPVNIFASHR